MFICDELPRRDTRLSGAASRPTSCFSRRPRVRPSQSHAINSRSRHAYSCTRSAAMVRRLHIKVRGLDPPEHQLIRPCTWLKFTLKYHAWFEIRNSKFEIMNRPGESVLAKFRSLRPAEKALLSLIYILSAMTKCGPKLVFWVRSDGARPPSDRTQKTSFGPNFDIGEFYDRGGPCTRGPAYHSSEVFRFSASKYVLGMPTSII